MVYCRDCINCRCKKINNPKLGEWDIWCRMGHWNKRKHNMERFLTIDEGAMVIRQECPDFEDMNYEAED